VSTGKKARNTEGNTSDQLIHLDHASACLEPLAQVGPKESRPSRLSGPRGA